MKINFTPGPSQLYFTVEGHARQAFKQGIPSISHRSKEFEAIYANAVIGLRELMSIPNDFHIVFTSSATEIWERSIQNFVNESSHHFVNGAFSKRYFEIAQQLGKNPAKTEAPDGHGFDSANNIGDSELIALTHNETSTGVSLPLNFIHSFRQKFPNALIAVDAVSSVPYPAFDFNSIDTLFFSVQKGLGLPAGLGVWIANDRCLAKAEQIQSKGKSIGSYHSLPSLVSLARKYQTPETPNVLGIYLLSCVINDLLRRGITSIRQETEYKSALLYHALSQSGVAKPFVKESQYQSRTVIVADTGTATEHINAALQPIGLFPGDGYGKAKATQLRFANFPAHSKEQYELLVDSLAKL